MALWFYLTGGLFAVSIARLPENCQERHPLSVFDKVFPRFERFKITGNHFYENDKKRKMTNPT